MNTSDDFLYYVRSHDDIIPKKVIQCGQINKKSRQSIYNYMKDYHYTYISEEDSIDFVKKNFPYQVELYKNIRDKTLKKKLLIYMWMYVEGGIYIDSNYELVDKLDITFRKEFDIYFSGHRLIISRPRCQLWLDFIDEIRDSRSLSVSSVNRILEQSRDKYLVISNIDRYLSEIRNTWSSESYYFIVILFLILMLYLYIPYIVNRSIMNERMQFKLSNER